MWTTLHITHVCGQLTVHLLLKHHYNRLYNYPKNVYTVNVVSIQNIVPLVLMAESILAYREIMNKRALLNFNYIVDDKQFVHISFKHLISP